MFCFLLTFKMLVATSGKLNNPLKGRQIEEPETCISENTDSSFFFAFNIAAGFGAGCLNEKDEPIPSATK